MTVISAAQLQPAPEPQSIEALLARAAASVRLEIAGVGLEVWSSEPGLCDALAERFRDHLSRTRSPDLRYFVLREEDGYLFCSPGMTTGWRWRKGPLSVDALAFLADAAAISALVRSDRNLVSYHAAAVEHRGRAAAIVGSSEAGKTTTLLACARLGMRVYSDERLILRDDAVQPFLRTCGVREGGAQLLLADDSHDALAAKLKSGDCERLSIVETFGPGAVAKSASLGFVFVLAGSSSQAKVEPIASHDAVSAFTQWADASAGYLELVARTVAMLAKVRSYRLVLGRPSESAHCLRDVLDGG